MAVLSIFVWRSQSINAELSLNHAMSTYAHWHPSSRALEFPWIQRQLALSDRSASSPLWHLAPSISLNISVLQKVQIWMTHSHLDVCLELWSKRMGCFHARNLFVEAEHNSNGCLLCRTGRFLQTDSYDPDLWVHGWGLWQLKGLIFSPSWYLPVMLQLWSSLASLRFRQLQNGGVSTKECNWLIRKPLQDTGKVAACHACLPYKSHLIC